MSFENETWLIDEGDRIIKKASGGVNALTRWEQLVCAFWAADYGMRNAGDLEVTKDVDPDFQETARRCGVEELSLPLTREIFAMELIAIESVYFDRFDAICEEIKNAKSRVAS